MDASTGILNFIINPFFEGPLSILRIVFIAFGLLLLGGIIFSLSRSSYIKWYFFEDVSEFLTFRPAGVKKLVKTWNKVTARLDTGLESEYKLAIIEADSILDDVLRRMGYRGESLGERLNNLTSATLPNIEELKSAHQSRTDILHNPDQSLSLNDARTLLSVFEKALDDLQAF